MGDGGEGREVGGEGDGGDGSDGLLEGLEELLVGDVEHGGGEDVALVVDLDDAETVGEGGDVEHVEEGGLGGADLGVGLDELEIGGDFNGTTGNLGGDTEGLEEGGLAGFHAGVSGGDPDVDGGDGTGTSGGGNSVVEDLVADLLEVGVGEDEADVASDEGEEALVVGEVSDEGTKSTSDLQRTSSLAARKKRRQKTFNKIKGMVSAPQVWDWDRSFGIAPHPIARTSRMENGTMLPNIPWCSFP